MTVIRQGRKKRGRTPRQEGPATAARGMTRAERDEIAPSLISELLDTAAQGILAVNDKERIVLFNAMACAMFGYSRKEMAGRRLGSLLPRGLRRAHVAHVEGFFSKPARRPMGKGRDLMGLRKDGRLFPIEIALSAVESEHGRLAVAIISDISERKEAEAEIAESRARLRQLTQRLTTAVETENRKWARELHDVFSQRLVGVVMGLSQLTSESVSNARLRAIEDQVRTLAEDIHSLSRRMHPNILHDLGLVAALRSEIRAFGRESGIRTEFRTRGVPKLLPDEIALCLYRVAQETLRNIRKHSGATEAQISLLGRKGRLTLKVVDIGDGFDLDRALRTGGLGLISMEERTLSVGGEFSVISAPGKGTTVRASVQVA